LNYIYPVFLCYGTTMGSIENIGGVIFNHKS
jgi:hypothetical protein